MPLPLAGLMMSLKINTLQLFLCGFVAQQCSKENYNMASVVDRSFPRHRDHSLCLGAFKLIKITKRHTLSGNPDRLEADLLSS